MQQFMQCEIKSCPTLAKDFQCKKLWKQKQLLAIYPEIYIYCGSIQRSVYYNINICYFVPRHQILQRHNVQVSEVLSKPATEKIKSLLYSYKCQNPPLTP